MDEGYLKALFERLMPRDWYQPGLTDSEVASIEERYGFHFPPDLLPVLQYALPVDGEPNSRRGWVNWRSDDPDVFRWRLGLPLDGILFDIEHSNYWAESWGDRPADVREALEFATGLINDSPKLIPIYSHRFIPDNPHAEGNPIFSVHQTDIVYYGFDLPSFFHQQFGASLPPWAKREPRAISLWTEIPEANGVRGTRIV